MSKTVELLEQAAKKDDAAILWHAVKEATGEDSRTLRSRFRSTYAALDETQQAMFRSYVTIHSSKLETAQQELATAVTSC